MPRSIWVRSARPGVASAASAPPCPTGAVAVQKVDRRPSVRGFGAAAPDSSANSARRSPSNPAIAPPDRRNAASIPPEDRTNSAGAASAEAGPATVPSSGTKVTICRKSVWMPFASASGPAAGSRSISAKLWLGPGPEGPSSRTVRSRRRSVSGIAGADPVPGAGSSDGSALSAAAASPSDPVIVSAISGPAEGGRGRRRLSPHAVSVPAIRTGV